jgi:hypothetical protein
MTVTMHFPGLAIDFTETLANAVEAESAGELSPQEVQLLLKISRASRQVIAEAAAGFTRLLSEGVLIRRGEANVPKAEVARRLENLGGRFREAAKRLRGSASPPEHAEDLVAEMDALGGEILNFDGLLKDYSAAVNAPERPVDWERIRLAEEEFARGEFRRLGPRG